MKKVQKKYYLTEETAKWLRMASARTGISQSKILEAVILLEVVNVTIKQDTA